MNISSAGLSLLQEFEGCKLVPYNDPTGNATVGYGHLLHRGPLDGTEDTLTTAQDLSLLSQDVHTKAEVFVDQIKCPLNQNQYDALVCFCYNVGSGNLERVVSETGLNQGNYSAVPPKILLYDKAKNQSGVWVTLPGLVARRQKEAALFQESVQ